MPNTEDIKYKLSKMFKLDSGGDKSQYILAFGLLLVIVIAGISMFSQFSGDNTPQGPAELHFYDVETKEEIVLKPEEIDPEDLGMGMGPGMSRMTNPKTGKRTLVQMLRCPNCGKYHVPEAWLEDDFNPMGMGPEGMGDIICPHCGTNREEYYRQKMRERRSK